MKPSCENRACGRILGDGEGELKCSGCGTRMCEVCSGPPCAGGCDREYCRPCARERVAACADDDCGEHVCGDCKSPCLDCRAARKGDGSAHHLDEEEAFCGDACLKRHAAVCAARNPESAAEHELLKARASLLAADADVTLAAAKLQQAQHARDAARQQVERCRDALAAAEEAADREESPSGGAAAASAPRGGAGAGVGAPSERLLHA